MLFRSALYVATYVAATMGSRAIENWLGVSTGAKSGMMMAAGAGYAATKLAGGTVNAIAGSRMPSGQRAGGLVRGAGNMARGAKNFGGKAASATARGAKGAFNGVTKSAGAVSGFKDAAKQNGYGNAIKNNLGNAANKGIVQPLNKAGDAVKTGYDKAKTAVKNVDNAATQNFQQGSQAGFKSSTENNLTGGIDYQGQHYDNGYDPRPDYMTGGAQTSTGTTRSEQTSPASSNGNTGVSNKPSSDVGASGGSKQQIRPVQQVSQQQSQQKTPNSVRQQSQAPSAARQQPQPKQASTASQTPKSTPQTQQPQVKEDKLNRIGSKQNETEL